MTATSPEPLPTPGPPPGTVLGGKYTVERVLGVGGMGVVLAARHLHLDQRVAIKLLLPEAARDEGAVARFLREGRTSSGIRSEHVVRVHDVDVFPPWGPALVLELLDGRDLDAVVSEGPLPCALAVDYLLQACEAIAEAHALGIVHRDLKPQNLFLTHRADGTACVKVLDFGISKIKAAAGDHRLTSTGMIFGTPAYMAPEQMREARDTDARTDIWALGSILFELCTGQTPFVAGSITELAAKVLIDAAPSLRALRADVPRELAEAVARCLEKDPARRFQTVAELARAVAGCGTAQARASADRIAAVLDRAGGKPSAPAVVLGAAPDPHARTALAGTLSPSTVATPPLRRRVLPGLGAALAVGGALGIAAGVAYFALRTPGGVAPPAAATATTASAPTPERPASAPTAATAATTPSAAPVDSAGAAPPAAASSAPPHEAPVRPTPPRPGPRSAPSSGPAPGKHKPDGIAHDRDG